MKAKIVNDGIGTYEVRVKRSWLSPWATVYDGMFPWRGSYKQARKLVNKYRNL